MRKFGATLDIIGSVINLYYFADDVAYIAINPEFWRENLFGFPLIALVSGVVCFIGGYQWLQRRKWAWALAGSLLIIPVPLISIIDMRFTLIFRHFTPLLNIVGLAVGITAVILALKSRYQFLR